MPQLDTYIFLSQVFWLLLLFTIFYILILNNILPNISRVLKLRRKRLSSQTTSLFSAEEDLLKSRTSDLIEFSVKDSTKFLSGVRNSSLSWLASSLEEANKKTFLDLNKNFLRNIGELKGQSLVITKIIRQN